MIDMQFIEGELENLEKTAMLLEKFLKQNEWNEAETAGYGKFLSDMYMGYENIFEAFLREKNIRVPKGERWHSDLLERAIIQEIAPHGWTNTLKGMLGFRHFQIHGYAHMLDETYLRENSAEVAANHPIFVAHIKKILDDA